VLCWILLFYYCAEHSEIILKLASDMSTLLKRQEDDDSVKGSDCKLETYNKFGFGPLTPQLVRRTLVYTPTSKTFARLASAVLLYTQDMVVYARHDLTDEIKYIQPRFQKLLQKLIVFMDMSACVDVQYKRGSNAVKYHSREYGIHGEMDAGIFLPNTATCLLPVEVKNLDDTLIWKWITQCAGEMAGKLELLKSGYDISPRTYCGILVSGRRWVVLFRQCTAGARLWQYATELTTFNDAGQIDYRSLYKVIILLHHSLVVTKNVFEEISASTLKQSSKNEDRGEPYVYEQTGGGGTGGGGKNKKSHSKKDRGRVFGRDLGSGEYDGGNVYSQGKENIVFGPTSEDFRAFNKTKATNLTTVDKFVRREY
jgi:hypothetical protein